MNHQRKPRLGLVRPLPLPLDQILKPPDAFLRNGPIVRRSAAARNGRDAARVSGRNGRIQLRNRAGNSGSVITLGTGAFEVCLWPPLDQEARKEFERLLSVLLGCDTIEGQAKKKRCASTRRALKVRISSGPRTMQAHQQAAVAALTFVTVQQTEYLLRCCTNWPPVDSRDGAPSRRVSKARPMG